MQKNSFAPQSQHLKKTTKWIPCLTSLALCFLTTGCNTLGTLASQFNETPLPPRVASKLYGVCRDCHTHGILPGCEKCIVVQQYRRKFAGMSASQITAAMAAEAQNTPLENRQSPSMRNDATLKQARWIREEPPQDRRKAASPSIYSQKPKPEPQQDIPSVSRSQKATPLPPSPYPTPSTPRKPDIFDALGYGDN